MNIDRILCRLLEGSSVSEDQRAAVLAHVRQRVEAGEKGDDLPIAMEALGINYEAACKAVQSEDKASQLELLAAVGAN